ncbi:glycosyltransferase family 39 protein [Xanthobacter autotrophicus DSM 431]|uniref:ArnT family glycosyltransferase n=1 Tax=Xanthobacter nonsaccharivorans TaxID=3119912 RepID=UPI0037271B8E
MSVLQFERRPGTIADACAVALLAAVVAIAILTFSDYGLGWDDFTHSQYGDLLYSYFSSGLTQRKVFSFVNLYYYGGGFDLIAATLAKLLPFVDVFDIRRLLGALVGLAGFFIVWRTGRRLAGPWGGLAAMALLMICPLFFGHMFMNAKDAPFAVSIAGLIYATVRAFDEFPNPTPRTVTLFGLCLGLSVGTRVMGLMTGVYIVAAIGFVLVAESFQLGLKDAAKRTLRFCGLLALGGPLAYFVMGIAWPWGVAEPLNPLMALKYYSVFWEVPWREMFDGRAIMVPDMPRIYVPLLFSVQMPEIFLGLVLSGAAGAVVTVFFGKEAPAKRARLVLIVTAAFFPIMLTVVARPVVYNGIRHFVFITPALSLLGGFAAAWIWERAQRMPRLARGAVAAAILVGFALPAKEFRTLHPYEYTYYNNFVGGTRGADSLFMLDYWGLAFKQAAAELDEYVEKHRWSLPQGRKLRVAVCGPHFAAAAELGPRYETTYDSKNADFYLMLGEFYCAEVKAPTLVKIERDGVTYATVYDVRGRPFPSVFAEGQ